MQPRIISFIIIAYNNENLLQGCIDTILNQTYEPIEVIFIDNHSKDGSAALVEKFYASDPRVKIIKNPDNKGYSGAGNQGIALAKGEYVVITNPDIRYEPTYFEHAVAHMQQDENIGALVGKVLKYDFSKKTQFSEGEKTSFVDTVGLFIYRSRRVIDDGQGLEDKGQFEQEREVFGISGACPLYRKKALEDAKILGEYLDDDFFMYKEDVDLSWRLQLFGWKCIYFPKSIAYHGRGTGVAQRFTNDQLLNERKKLSHFQKKFSIVNQHLMQIKNDLWGNIWHDFFPIFLKEIAIIGYVTLREPKLWKELPRFFKLLPKALKKRKEIMKKKRVGAKEMQKWFRGQSRFFQ